MNIFLEYRLTPEDLRHYYKVYSELAYGIDSSKPPPRRIHPLIGWGTILALVIIIFLILNHYTSPRPASSAPAPPSPPWYETFWPYGALSVAIYFNFVWKGRSSSSVRREFVDKPELSELQHLEVTDDAMTSRTPTCTTIMTWHHFIHFGESPDMFLLFHSRLYALILPKRAFPSSADIDSLRTHLQAHVGNKPLGFPAQLSPPPVEPKPSATDAQESSP